MHNKLWINRFVHTQKVLNEQMGDCDTRGFSLPISFRGNTSYRRNCLMGPNSDLRSFLGEMRKILEQTRSMIEHGIFSLSHTGAIASAPIGCRLSPNFFF